MRLSISYRQGYRILRVITALFLVAHGVTRLSLGTVGDFGNFLGSKGFPFGTGLAWVLTIVEILGGLILAAGFLVRVLCAWFICELIFGMILVHAPNGWFVVGATQGGIEYSVLLVVVLLVVALTFKTSKKTGTDPGT